MKLNELSPNAGARKTRRRVGRGHGSGAGRTSGKGEKGQKARSGGHTRPGFEGGQMPLYRRLPKFGFRSAKQIRGKNQYSLVSLSVLEQLDAGSVVDCAALKAAGVPCKSKHRAGYKILGTGNLTKKLTVKVAAVSETARQKIEAVGGTIELIVKPAPAE